MWGFTPDDFNYSKKFLVLICLDQVEINWINTTVKFKKNYFIVRIRPQNPQMGA